MQCYRCTIECSFKAYLNEFCISYSLHKIEGTKKPYPFSADRKNRITAKFLSVSNHIHVFGSVIVLQTYPCSVELFSMFPELGKILEVLVLILEGISTCTQIFFKMLNEYSYMKNKRYPRVLQEKNIQ